MIDDVTHEQVEATTLADKIVTPQAGRIEQVGPPLQVSDDPANLFVAGLIGNPKIKVLSARVADPETRTLVLAGDGSARPAMPWLRDPLSAGQEVVLGVRPQHLRLSGDGLLCARAEVVEHLGDVGYMHGVALDETEIVAQVQDRASVRPFQEVRLEFEPSRAFLFDAAGRRLR